MWEFMVTATKVFISNRKFMQKFTKFHKGARFHVYNTIQARIAGGRVNWVQTSIRCRMMVLICSSVFVFPAIPSILFYQSQALFSLPRYFFGNFTSYYSQQVLFQYDVPNC